MSYVIHLYVNVTLLIVHPEVDENLKYSISSGNIKNILKYTHFCFRIAT